MKDSHYILLLHCWFDIWRDKAAEGTGMNMVVGLPLMFTELLVGT